MSKLSAQPGTYTYQGSCFGKNKLPLESQESQKEHFSHSLVSVKTPSLQYTTLLHFCSPLTKQVDGWLIRVTNASILRMFWRDDDIAFVIHFYASHLSLKKNSWSTGTSNSSPANLNNLDFSISSSFFLNLACLQFRESILVIHTLLLYTGSIFLEK